MSERNFARRFVEESGITPACWVVRQRVLAARELLEHSHLSIKQIAANTGWSSPQSLREQFRRQGGTTPALYRSAFQKPASPER